MQRAMCMSGPVGPECYCSSALRVHHVPENQDCSADHHYEDPAMAENHQLCNPTVHTVLISYYC